jgi:hypothetical protein
MNVTEYGWIEEELFKRNISDSEEIKFAASKRTVTVDDKESIFNTACVIPKAFQPSVINWFYVKNALLTFLCLHKYSILCIKQAVIEVHRN